MRGVGLLVVSKTGFLRPGSSCRRRLAEEHENEGGHHGDPADGDERIVEMIEQRPRGERVVEPKHHGAARHAEADRKLLGYGEQAVSGAGVFGGKVSEGDAVHGRELGGHGHAEHEQGENEHPQGQGGRLEGELGNHEPMQTVTPVRVTR